MSLPYDWKPDGTTRTTRLDEQDLIAYKHRVYRVMETKDVREDRTKDDDVYRYRYTLRPIEVQDHDPYARDKELHVKTTEAMVWNVYEDDHYPICSQCGEPTPCREKTIEAIVAEAEAEASRYDDQDICPNCLRPTTHTRRTLTWAENIIILGGPPVTYHGLGSCRTAAEDYEKRWAAKEPGRRIKLSCEGNMTHLPAGGHQCSAGRDCPGPGATHSSLLCMDPAHRPHEIESRQHNPE